MADPDKDQAAALEAFESQVNQCTADLETRHDEHWTEVETSLADTRSMTLEPGRHLRVAG